jgi:hypothetical protein
LGEGWLGRAPALALPMKIAKPKHRPIVHEKGRRDVQRRIAQERVPPLARSLVPSRSIAHKSLRICERCRLVCLICNIEL